MFKVNIRNGITRCEICSKLKIKIPERHQWGRSGVFFVNPEHISHIDLVFLLLTLSGQTPAGETQHGISVTHFMSMIYFYTPWKHKKHLVFREYRKRSVAWNDLYGLSHRYLSWISFYLKLYFHITYKIKHTQNCVIC